MPACQPRLSIVQTAQSPPHLLNIGGEAQFLNGINLAWVRFPDFVGTGAGSLISYCGTEDAMRFLVANGGNALRVWVLQEPAQSLVWTGEGLVAGLAPGFLEMAKTILELGLHYNVKLIFALFNGALVRGEDACVSWSRFLDHVSISSTMSRFLDLGALNLSSEPEL